MVYFITCRDLGRVKIGHATDPKRRLQGLQTGCPKPLALEACLEGGEAEERTLHIRFAEHREKGEWFNLCPEIDALIKELNPPQRPRNVPFEQGEYVGPFVFDPTGWIERFGEETPREDWPAGVTNWLRWQEQKAA